MWPAVEEGRFPVEQEAAGAVGVQGALLERVVAHPEACVVMEAAA